MVLEAEGHPLFSECNGERECWKRKGSCRLPTKWGKRTAKWERAECTGGVGVGTDSSVFQVYLKARAEGSANHEEHVSQLKSEVRHIQEVSQTPRGSGCVAAPCCAKLCRTALANWLNPPVC